MNGKTVRSPSSHSHTRSEPRSAVFGLSNINNETMEKTLREEKRKERAREKEKEQQRNMVWLFNVV